MVKCHLQASTDVAAEMSGRSQADAAVWFADWLSRRDELSTELAAEQLADALEALASELRGEARHQSTSGTRGLLLAAAVLFDTAFGVRLGDTLTPTEQRLRAG